MAAWWTFFKIFRYAFEADPLARLDQRDLTGAGVSQPDAMPDIRGGIDGAWGSGGAIRLRDSNDFIDLSTVTNRIHRLKEYDRLSNMAEIDMAMTVFSDETCLGPMTKIAAPAYGYPTIQWLAENVKDERFLVYCYDFSQEDFTLGWAFNPRMTKVTDTVVLVFDDGHQQIITPDHLVLTNDKDWKCAGDLKYGDKLTAFYRLDARRDLNGLQCEQYPRIRTHNKGWIHEKQFLDEWSTGREDPELEKTNKYCRLIASGLNVRQIRELTKTNFATVRRQLAKGGFSNDEIKWLGKKPDYRRVVGVLPGKKMPVYDLSVEKHKNFATDWGIVHNCQKDDDGKVLKIVCKNSEIKEELDYLLFHRKALNLDSKKMWSMAKQLFTMGDFFWEVVIDLDDPKRGILNLAPLPPDSMYRIETTKGKLVEFQQSKEGPDYQSLARVEVTQATDADLQQATAIRFAPNQIVHIRIGEEKKTFYPYGVSLIEAARGPAHQLRLMEDAMVVYRLVRAPERRVFYIDVQNLPPYKAEAFVERMKDLLKKRKTGARTGLPGAASVEERWHLPPADEDFWIPIRPNTNTRVETLQGAQNLGEIDDCVYFRNKLFTALKFPKHYYNNEDTQSTRITLSAQDAQFARLVERLQSYIQDAIWEVCDRHLKLRGYPEECYEDLQILMTVPSDYRELTRAEVISNRIGWATSLKSAQMIADFDILTKVLKYSEEEVLKMIARMKLQKLEDLKLQIIAQNPALLGVGVPGPDEEEVGTEPGGPSPELGGEPPAPEGMPPGGPPAPTGEIGPPAGGGQLLPEPNEEDIRKYNMDLQDYGREMDEEERDVSEE